MSDGNQRSLSAVPRGCRSDQDCRLHQQVAWRQAMIVMERRHGTSVRIDLHISRDGTDLAARARRAAIRRAAQRAGAARATRARAATPAPARSAPPRRRRPRSGSAAADDDARAADRRRRWG